MSNRRMGPAAMGPHKPINKATVKRLLGYVKPYWPRLILVLACVVLNAVATASAANFLGEVIDDHIMPMLAQTTPEWSGLLHAILRMGIIYALAIIAADTLRQLVSQVLPQTVSSLITLTVVFISMLRCSVWMTLVMVAGTFFMLKATMKIGGGSAKYFAKQQTSLASLNGYIEEMVNGQ